MNTNMTKYGCKIWPNLNSPFHPTFHHILPTFHITVLPTTYARAGVGAGRVGPGGSLLRVVVPRRGTVAHGLVGGAHTGDERARAASHRQADHRPCVLVPGVPSGRVRVASRNKIWCIECTLQVFAACPCGQVRKKLTEYPSRGARKHTHIPSSLPPSNASAPNTLEISRQSTSNQGIGRRAGGRAPGAEPRPSVCNWRAMVAGGC